MARASKLTPVVSKALLDALRMGATQRLACQYAGISEDTLARWRALGTQGRKPYADFADAFTRAQGTLAVALLAKIEAAAAVDWRAAAWKLQHRFPRDYGLKVELSGDATNPVQVLQALPQDQLDARIQALLAQTGYGPAAAAPEEEPA